MDLGRITRSSLGRTERLRFGESDFRSALGESSILFVSSEGRDSTPSSLLDGSFPSLDS